MPELPEVETMRRGIASVAGLRITSAEFPRGTRRPIAVRPKPEILARRLAGRQIAAAASRGSGS
jgi:formamidopyrimidine-DNA glycosylase